MNVEDKEKLKTQLLAKLQTDLEQAKDSLASTQKLISSDDMSQEGKYDTRLTEANYLADGQRKRVSELTQDVHLVSELDTNQHEKNAIGSLTKLRINNVEKWYFISPTSGGTILTLSGEPIVVLSAYSPIGKQILGTVVNEDFEVEINDQTREYLIIAIV